MEREGFYKLLGIDANSSAVEARRALRKTVIKFHPDKFQQNKENFYEIFGVDDDDKVSKKANEYTQDLNSTYQNLYEKEEPKTEAESQKEQTIIDKVSAGVNQVLGGSKSYDVNKSEVKGQGLDGVDGKGMSGEDKSKGTGPKSAGQPKVPSSEKEANNFNKGSDPVQLMKSGDLQQVKEGLGGVESEEAGNTSPQSPDSTPTSESQRSSTPQQR